MINGVKVVYGIIDSSLKTDTITDNSSSTSSFANSLSVLESNENPKLAYLEKDYFLLDGSFIFPEDEKYYDVGWESQNLSSESGITSEYLQLDFQHNHDSYGVQIYFWEDCIPKDFTLRYYQNGVQVGNTVSVTNNTKDNYVDYNPMINWNRVRIDFSKINAQQRARVKYLVLGVADEYNEDYLTEVNATRTTDITGDYTRNGEVKFSFYNYGRFNIKSQKDLPISFQEGLRISVYIKNEGDEDYSLFSEYVSEDTNVSENGKIVTVTGYDALFALNDTNYKKGIVYRNGKSLGSWAEEVAQDAGIEVFVEPEFYSIISYGYIPEVSHREALRMIAEAGCGSLVVEPSGIISLQKLALKNVYDITEEHIVDNSYSIENSEKYLGVTVSKYTYGVAQDAVELGHLDQVLLTAEPQELEIVYSQFPADVDTIQVFVNSSGVTVTNKRIYADRILFNIFGTAGDTTFVTITGKPYNTAITVEERGSTLKNIKKIDRNTLITGNMASNVADYQYSVITNKYYYNAEIVMNRKVKLLDEVNLNGDDIIITEESFTITPDTIEENIRGIDK